MNERLMQFRVGVVVLFTGIIVVALLSWFGGVSKLVGRSYTIHIRFSEAPGVTRDTPVRKSGIRIGQVSDVTFADDDTTVLVTAKIDADRQLYHNETCQAVSSLLMGDAALEFVRLPGAEASADKIQDGETIQGSVTQDPTRAIASLQTNLVKTIGSVDTASKEMHSVLRRVDKLLENNSSRITNVIAQSDETLKLLQETLKSTNKIVGDEKVQEQFRRSMDKLPKVLDKMDDSLVSLRRNLDNVEEVTKPLSRKGGDIIDRVDASTKKLDRLMEEMVQFTRGLNDPQGSLGQLVHDREFYQHLSRAARNIQDLTRQLQPILDNAQIFSDKIARHPEILGVRGAVQRSSGLKWGEGTGDRGLGMEN